MNNLQENLSNLETYIAKVESQIENQSVMPEIHHFLNGLYAAREILSPTQCGGCGACPTPCDNESTTEL